VESAVTDSDKAHLLLVVEDDQDLHAVLEVGLSDSGFELILAKDGAQALEELEAGADRFKALVTDIRLGKGPSGWDVARRARELVPNLPVVYVSGDSSQEWAAQGVPESIMLQKPFVIAQLVTAVTTLMNQTTTTLPPPPSE
jgi:DNA-binding response OmpR family regulator